MTIISRSEFMGLDAKGRQRGGTPAIVECNDIRFFTVSATDHDHAKRINAAADKMISEGRVFRPE